MPTKHLAKRAARRWARQCPSRDACISTKSADCGCVGFSEITVNALGENCALLLDRLRDNDWAEIDASCVNLLRAFATLVALREVRKSESGTMFMLNLGLRRALLSSVLALLLFISSSSSWAQSSCPFNVSGVSGPNAARWAVDSVILLRYARGLRDASLTANLSPNLISHTAAISVIQPLESTRLDSSG